MQCVITYSPALVETNARRRGFEPSPGGRRCRAAADECQRNQEKPWPPARAPDSAWSGRRAPAQGAGEIGDSPADFAGRQRDFGACSAAGAEAADAEGATSSELTAGSGAGESGSKWLNWSWSAAGSMFRSVVSV